MCVVRRQHNWLQCARIWTRVSASTVHVLTTNPSNFQYLCLYEGTKSGKFWTPLSMLILSDLEEPNLAKIWRCFWGRQFPSPSLIRPVSEMTYTVSSGTLNSTIPYHTIHIFVVIVLYAELPNLAWHLESGRCDCFWVVKAVQTRLAVLKDVWWQWVTSSAQGCLMTVSMQCLLTCKCRMSSSTILMRLNRRNRWVSDVSR